MKLTNILWILPFAIFSLGYFVPMFFTEQNSTEVPNIVGKNSSDAMALCSKVELNLRLSRQQESIDLPEGIILEQAPKAGKKVRKNQNIFVTASKKPPAIKIPNFFGKNKKDLMDWAYKFGITPKFYLIKGQYPKGKIFGQSPAPEQNITNNQIIAYISQGLQNLVITPNFVGKTTQNVKSLAGENIRLDIIHARNNWYGQMPHECTDCVVKEQHPKPGTVIDLEKGVFMQLLVETPFEQYPV